MFSLTWGIIAFHIAGGTMASCTQDLGFTSYLFAVSSGSSPNGSQVICGITGAETYSDF